MKLTPYAIQIRNKTYTGYLGNSDVFDPPTRYFVFMDLYIVGELGYQDKWIFDQGNRRKLFSTLTVDECNYIAKYLGNIAELASEHQLYKSDASGTVVSTGTGMLLQQFLKMITGNANGYVILLRRVKMNKK